MVAPDLRIVRVLSNNAVLARDHVDERVMVGKGIGFGRKPGDIVTVDPTHRQYIELSSDKAQYLELLGVIDPRILETISAAIDFAVELLGELHPSVYVVLAEHLSFAVERVGRGETIESSLLNEVRAVFPAEFNAAELIVSYINANLDDVSLPVDEAVYIALHLKAARSGVTVKQPLATANAVADLVSLVRKRLGLEPTDGLVLELTRLNKRIRSGRFRTNAAGRAIRREMFADYVLSEEIIRHILGASTLSRATEGEVAFLAVFLHGWRQEQAL
ncbi:PRD domain-containing protein [Corynebacterium freiburgense]|uniref:PRD domain-containing protein n=1 Tax=Corynebacterium freiburgense TaxID=556548 RepID=UPI00040F0451|nr:PRD domain-containing protein [Corynebacterium freiburgense]WJZ02048.1 Cryptic beta-glucoside bgl operon antiterminator [Corynebacterium freiburgense]